MWLPRVIADIMMASRPVALIGGESYGTPFVVDAMRERSRVAWIALAPPTRNDPVAQGNDLARAVNAVLPAPLLPMALPYRAHLNALRRYRSDVQPLCIAVTTEMLDQPVIDELLDLQHDGYRIVLDVRGHGTAVAAVLDRCDVMGPTVLGVSAEEARQLAPGALADHEVSQLWRATEGRFTELSVRAQQAAGLPTLLIPSPGGPLLVEREAELVEPTLAVLALKREGELLAAMELAVLRAPHMVDELLRTAGPRFQEHGLLARLHVLLTALPAAEARSERVLEWRLVAAFAAGDFVGVIEDVDAHLSTHAAPLLRARRAGTIPRAKGFALAKEAVETRRTPLTVWQFGRLHPNSDMAIALLRESVQLAEDSGTRYELARNAASLATKLNLIGHYARSASWSRWALDVFDQDQLQDGMRRLLIVNELAVARIMTGDLVGLRRRLQDAQVVVEGSLPQLAVLMRSTLAQLELAENRPLDALELLSAAYHGSPRRTRPRYGFQYVRVLTELSRGEEAQAVAADVTEIGDAGEPVERSLATLARGIAGVATGVGDAGSDLLAAMLDPELVADQRLTAALYYLLASGGAAHNIPGDLTPLLRDVHPTALRVLSGPESLFAPVWATLTSATPVLSFRFLGGVECRYEGHEVSLPPRLAEVAVALAVHADGMTRDKLNDFLTPEGHAPFSSGGMRGMMTRLRTLLPVSDAPYRFTVPYRADFLEVREHVAAGRVREAVALLRGPLLPQSETPGVEEQRWALEEELRQAALLVGDPDALYDLAERLDDDLEFWEAAADSLGSGDPRLALARARVRRLAEAYGVDP